MSADQPTPDPKKPAADGTMNHWPPVRVLTPAPWPPAQVAPPPPPPPPVFSPPPVPAPPPPAPASSAEMRKLGAPAADDGDDAEPYRPTRRPPVPFLTVMDDGATTGEYLRLRGRTFVIGRGEGDLTLPTDQLCSKRHAEIAFETTAEGGGLWVVTDLQSLHGTFFRLRRAPLANGAEFLVGGGRYRLELPADPPADPPAEESANLTLGREAVAPAAPPILRELALDRAGRTFELKGAEVWIGTAAACAIRRDGDPFTSPRHVKLTRDPRGVWFAENNKTANGLWVRLPRLVVKEECAFQIGEQRFRLSLTG